MYDSEVQLTDKPDMFTMDDEEGGQRAEMPCGHAVGTFHIVVCVFTWLYKHDPIFR